MYVDLLLSLQMSSTSVVEENGAASRVCAVITTMELTQDDFVVSFYTSDGTGMQCRYKALITTITTK